MGPTASASASLVELRVLMRVELEVPEECKRREQRRRAEEKATHGI